MNDGIYYLRVNGQVDGPYTIGQIYDLWAARKINSQTPFARFEEMDKWQPLSELTLKISAPKTLTPRVSAVEPAPSIPLRQKNPLPPEAEEYAPSMVYPREQREPLTEEVKPLMHSFSKRMVFNFSVSSGICIVCGIAIALYSLVLSAASSDGKEIRQDILVSKQNAMVAGVGLILMGGLLIVARQITQLILVLKAGALNQGVRKPSHSP